MSIRAGMKGLPAPSTSMSACAPPEAVRRTPAASTCRAASAASALPASQVSNMHLDVMEQQEGLITLSNAANQVQVHAQPWCSGGPLGHARPQSGCRPENACNASRRAGAPQSNCTPGTALPGLLAQYVTPGTGQLACSQGADVVYPPAAPGFVYDPTGSSNSSVRSCSPAVQEMAGHESGWSGA